MTDFTAGMQRQTYMIIVLWLAGWSIGNIAAISKTSTGSIRGMVHRRLPKPRGDMTFEERQALLDEMKTDRRDLGELGGLMDHHFRAYPLRPEAVKPSKPKADPGQVPKGPEAQQRVDIKVNEPKSVKARKQARRRRRAQKVSTESGFAERRGEKSAALEFLSGQKLLADPAEKDSLAFKKDIGHSGMRRLEAGLRFRRYIDGTRIGGLKSVDYESTSVGSNLGLPPTVYKFQCIDTLKNLRSMMSRADFRLIEGVIDRDDFAWERGKPKVVQEEIRRVLDIVAVHEGLSTPEAFKARWGARLPRVGRPSRSHAMKTAAAAADYLAEAGKLVK